MAVEPIPRGDHRASTHRQLACIAWLVSQPDLLGVARGRAGLRRAVAVASDVFATQQNLFNVTRNFAFVGHHRDRHDRGHHHRRHRPVGRRGAGAVGHGDRHDDERRHVRSGSAMPLALGASLLVGAFNGVMIAYVGMPPFVVTLGMLSIARSLGDGAVEQPHGLRVRARPAAAAGARRRIRRAGAALRRRDPVPNPVIVLLVMLAAGHRLRVPLDALGPLPLRHRRQRARRDADRRAGQARQGQRLHVLQPVRRHRRHSRGRLARHASPPASARAWS